MIRSLFAACLLGLSTLVAAAADDLPRQLTAELIEMEHASCQTSTGYGTAFVQKVDIDGDGRKDVVLDYADVLCGGVHEPYCDSTGCVLKAWVAAGGTYRKVFDGRVRSWSVEATGNRSVLLVDGKPIGR